MSQYTLTILHTYICYRLYRCHNKIIYIAHISILYNTHIYTCYRICTYYIHIYTIYTPCSSSPLAFWVHSCLSIDCSRSRSKKGESRGKVGCMNECLCVYGVYSNSIWYIVITYINTSYRKAVVFYKLYSIQYTLYTFIHVYTIHTLQRLLQRGV